MTLGSIHQLFTHENWEGVLLAEGCIGGSSGGQAGKSKLTVEWIGSG